MNIIDELVYVITGDTSGFQKAMSEANKIAKSTETAIRNTLNSTTKSILKMPDSIRESVNLLSNEVEKTTSKIERADYARYQKYWKHIETTTGLTREAILKEVQMRKQAADEVANYQLQVLNRGLVSGSVKGMPTRTGASSGGRHGGFLDDYVFDTTGDYEIINEKNITKSYDAFDAAVRRSGKGVDKFVKSVSTASDKLGTLFGLLKTKIAVDVLKDVIKEATAAEKAITRINAVFEEASVYAKLFASSASESLGLARTEAAQSLGYIGEILSEVGYSSYEAERMSETLVRLGVDLQSMTQGAVSAKQAVTQLGQAMLGNYRAVRSLGIALTDVNLKELGEALGYDTENMDAFTQTFLRYRLILNQTTTAQGDYVRNSETMANLTQELRANFFNLKEAIGEELLPVAKSAVRTLNDLLTILGRIPALSGAVASFIGVSTALSVLSRAIQFLAPNLFSLSKNIHILVPALTLARKEGKTLSTVFSEDAIRATQLSTAMTSLKSAAITLGTTLAITLGSAIAKHIEDMRDVEGAVNSASKAWEHYISTKDAVDFQQYLSSLIGVNDALEQQAKYIRRLEFQKKGLEGSLDPINVSIARLNKRQLEAELREVTAEIADANIEYNSGVRTIAAYYNTLNKANQARLLNAIASDDVRKAVVKMANNMKKAADEEAKAAEVAGKDLTGLRKEADKATKSLNGLTNAVQDNAYVIEYTWRDALNTITKELDDTLPTITSKISFALSDAFKLKEAGIVRAKDFLSIAEPAIASITAGIENTNFAELTREQAKEMIDAFTDELSKIEQYDVRALIRAGIFDTEYEFKIFINYIQYLIDLYKIEASAAVAANETKTDSYEKLTGKIKENTEAVLESLKSLEVEASTGIDWLDTIIKVPDTFADLSKKLKDVGKDIATALTSAFNYAFKADPAIVEQFSHETVALINKFIATGDLSGIKELKETLREDIEDIADDDTRKKAEEAFGSIFDAIDQFCKLRALNIVNSIGQTVTDIFTGLAESLGNLLETLSDNYIGVLQAQLSEMQDRYDDLKKLMDARNDKIYDGMTVKQKDAILRQKQMDEEELARQKEQMEAQEELIEEAQRKAWERQKAINLATAYLNGNMAVLSAFTATLGNTALKEYALPLAIMNAATAKLYSYAQIAAIAAQQYPSYDVGAYNLPQDQSGVTVHKGEMIIPKVYADSIREHGGFLTGDSDLANGTVIVNVYGTKDDVAVEESENEKYKQIDIYVSKKVKGMVATGQLDNVLQQRFAVSRNGRRG